MENYIHTDLDEKISLHVIDQISNNLGEKLTVAHANLKMVIIIPAKNEVENIIETLSSLLLQTGTDNCEFDTTKFEILVLSHNCSDKTFIKARSFFRINPKIYGHVLELNSDVANTVGAARRILMNIAYNRLENPNGLIISTDADTIVDEKWLCNLEYYIDTDISLVCGMIIVNPINLGMQAKKYLLAKDEYLLLKSKLESQLLPNPHDAWPRHGYNWGPNLAIKKNAYAAIGGIRPLHFLEDVDLYHRVISHGFLARHCKDSIVKTSTRIDSRCVEGFGAELKVWSDFEGVAYNVEGLDKLLVRFKIYNLIHQLYRLNTEDIFIQLEILSIIDLEEIKTMFSTSSIAEAMIIKMEKFLNNNVLWNSKHKNIDVSTACSQLNKYFEQYLYTTI